MPLRAVLLDIEGTTTPVSFVFDVLFPYSRARLEEYLATHGTASETKADLDLLRREFDADTAVGKPQVWSPLPYLRYLIDVDRKSPALKSLQGKIWEFGYRNGSLHGEVFPDVPAAFQRWRARNIQIFIYSSGSVLAQKLLFAHSRAGDLTRYIQGYFDTAIGPKRESKSYQRIVNQIGSPPADCLFISDIRAELDAAAQAGLQVLYSKRPGNKDEGPVEYRSIENFDSI